MFYMVLAASAAGAPSRGHPRGGVQAGGPQVAAARGTEVDSQSDGN
jgi:hypothetical protein